MATLTSKLVVELLDRATGPSRAIASSIQRLTNASRANSARLEAMRGRMVGVIGAGYALYKGLSAPIRAAVDFESAMADIRKVVNFDSPEAFKKMGFDIRDMSKRMPMAAKGIAEIVAAAGQSGIANSDLLKFAEIATKVGVAWDTAAKETGQSLAELKAGLGLSLDDTASLADAINHLGNNSAASAPRILDVVQRVASSAKQFGLSAEQTAAFGAAMVGAGFDSNVAATSILNMGRALVKGASATKRQVKAFKMLGLTPIRVAKAMQKDAPKTIQAVLARINKVPAHMRASIISNLFGDEARALGPLIGNQKLLAETLDLIGDKAKYAGSAQKEYDDRSQTTGNNIQLFQNRVHDLSISIGDALAPGLNRLMDAAEPLIETFSDLARRFPRVTQTVVVLSAGLIALKAAAIGVPYALLWMKGGALIAATGALKGLGGAMKVATIAAWPLTASFRALRAATGALALSAVLGNGAPLRAVGSSMGAALRPTKLLTAAVKGLRIAMLGIPGVAALTVLAGIGTSIYNNWSGIKEMFSGLWEELKSQFPGVTSAIQPVIDGFQWLLDKFTSITGPIDMSKEAWRDLGKSIGQFLGGAITSVIDKIKSLFKWLTDIPSKIKGMISAAAGASPSSFGVTMPADAMAGKGLAGARAAGGPVRAGASYLVGERGPELFTAPASGRIHDAMATVQAIKAHALAGAAKAAGNTVNHNNRITITVNAAPGQSPEEVAQAVHRVLSDQLNALSRGAHSDGAY